MTDARGSGSSSSERMAALLESLEITPMQKELLRNRWLDQVGWMSRQARKAHARYLWVRLPTVLGGVAIPGILAILLSAGSADHVTWLFNVETQSIRLLAFFLSLGVAALAALDEVLRYGDRWRHYRRTAELLKTLGWQYLMRNGAFRRYASHGDAFAAFTERVEDALNEDVEGYLSAVTAEGAEKHHEIII